MGKVLMLRPGSALGDACWASPIPRLLTEKGHEVTLAIDEASKPIYENSPYVKDIYTLPPQIRWKEWENNCLEIIGKYDHCYHLHGHVEVNLLHRSDSKWGNIPGAKERRKISQGKNYQDEIFINADIADKSCLPEFYFTKHEKKQGEKLKKLLRKDGKRLIVWQWDGSSRSKSLVWMPTYIRKVMDKYPDAVHYVFSFDKFLRDQIPKNDVRVFDATGKTSPRESIVLTSIADLVIGPESFLINAAAAFDTPKIVFFSHSAPENLTKYFKNCWNIIPETDCSPCYLIQTHFQRIFDPQRRSIAREFEHNCMLWNENYVYESLGYKCCYFLPHEKVYQSIDEVLNG